MRQPSKTNRNAEMLQAYQAGMKQSELAIQYAITRTRVRQILINEHRKAKAVWMPDLISYETSLTDDLAIELLYPDEPSPLSDARGNQPQAQ